MTKAEQARRRWWRGKPLSGRCQRERNHSGRAHEGCHRLHRVTSGEV